MAKFNKLKVNEVLSESTYYKVIKIVGNQAQLQTDTGKNIVVDNQIVENCLKSADQFETEEKKTRTELSEILFANPNVAMTVSYNKKVDPKTVLAEIMNAHQNTAPKDIEKAFKKAINTAIEGEERIMRGRHYGNIDNNGRLNFHDMDVDSGNPNRLVDPRTLNFLIVNGVKYIQK